MRPTVVPVPDLHREDRLTMAVEALHTHWVAICRACEPFWAECDLSIGQVKALIQLDANGPLTVSGLGTALGLSRPTASVLTEQMVQRGLVLRVEDATDRRRALVHLTEAGRDFAARLLRGNVKDWRRRCDSLGDADLIALARILDLLTAAGDEE